MNKTQAAQPVDFISGKLARARGIWRVSEALSRLFVWLAVLLVCALALSFLDNMLRLPGLLRLCLSLAWVACVAVALPAWVLRPLFWRISDQAAAVYLERKLGERENLLINAVQLGGRTAVSTPGVSRSMIEHVVSRAAARAAEISLQALWDRCRLRKLGMVLGLAVALLALYVLLLPSYARNAYQRFSRPLSGVPPLSKTRVFASPAGEIEVFAGDKLTVFALAADPDGNVPAEAALLARAGGAKLHLPMQRSVAAHPDIESEARAALPRLQPADASCCVGFSYEFANVNESFFFYVTCGDGESRPCHVRVRARPELNDLNIEIAPPAYTGLAATREPSSSGAVCALQGACVTLDFASSIALNAATLAVPGGAVEARHMESGRWQARFDVVKEGTYEFNLRGTDGAEAAHAFQGRISVRPDALPGASFENAVLNIAVLPGSTVPLAVRAQDDLGLKSLRLVVRQGMGGDGESVGSNADRALKAWKFPIPGPRVLNELYPLSLNVAEYPAGGVFSVYAEVCDHCPTGRRVYCSAPLVIRVLTAGQMSVAANSPFASIFARIQELIELQTKSRGKTVTVREFMDEVFAKNQLPARLAGIREAQSWILQNAQKLLADISAARDEKVRSGADKLARELKSMIDSPMTQAVAELREVAVISGDKKRALSAAETEEKLQSEIINRLTALLGSIGALDKDKKIAQADLKDDQDGQRLRDKLENAQEKVKEFIEAQKKAINSSEELEKKKPDDLTEEDKKTLGELAREEQDWAKYFKEQFTDLSKVPNQDFSNSKLAGEFNEVFQEIQKAAEALQARNVEIAVRNEEAGLELAKALETNLEKWLPDTRDTQKWNMEEPKGEFDVPLADLPQELEDIIGELIDEEEKMTEDVQDTSSSWMDSLDKGAGWDAADGNISNMSAKGVTGNRQPNDMEISGRSGEGRSGKSNGQFVEETADGKGGKQTPTRLTQDPYEQGQVKDSSKDLQGGSTGGGKESGAASAGLRGAPPPQTLKKLERLQGVQADIRQKAEKVSTLLKAYHLPGSDCDEAVRRMRQIESGLASGQGFDLRQAHSGVVDSLKESRKILGFQGEINKERGRELPKHVRNKIISGMHSDAPKGYQDLMEAYYKALVEPDK
jgi:hypothetical protein